MDKQKHIAKANYTGTVQAAANKSGKKGKAIADKRMAMQRKANNTGLPDNLKSGIENLSGMSMDHVQVHYNSAQPAQLNAHAYAQGSQIHVAPGQEKHLPHEAWHVVQQAQGRVRPTMQAKGNVPVNDDKGLEKEADIMGGKAVQLFSVDHTTPSGSTTDSAAPAAQRSTMPIVQRAVTAKKNKSGVWTLSGRPAFRSFVKATLVEAYNFINGTSHDPKTISLSDEELDQCHKVAWENIRNYVQGYLNGDYTDTQFRNDVAVKLYNNQATVESLNAIEEVNAMIKEKNNGTLEASRVVEVCTLLNSATPNLRLDDKYINRKIRQHFDPHLEYSPGGTHLSATPHTKELADSDWVSSGVKYSPGGTHGYSSSVGVFNRGDLTPDTKNRGAFN